MGGLFAHLAEDRALSFMSYTEPTSPCSKHAILIIKGLPGVARKAHKKTDTQEELTWACEAAAACWATC